MQQHGESSSAVSLLIFQWKPLEMDIQVSTRCQELLEEPAATFSFWGSPVGLSTHEQPCPAWGCSTPAQHFRFADCNPTPPSKIKKKKKKAQPEVPHDFRGTVERALSALLDHGQSLQHLAVWSPVGCPLLFIESLLPA